MKIFFKALIVIVVALLCIYFMTNVFLPPILDKKYNSIVNKPPYRVSSQAQALYDSLDFVADLHSDVLLWGRNILQENDYGHEDLPRMLQAKLALQAFTVVNKVPKGQNFIKNSGDTDILTLPHILLGRPVRSWFSLSERVIAQANELKRFSQNSNGKLHLIHDKKSLRTYLKIRESNQLVSAGFLGIEGVHAFEGNLAMIDALFDVGVRMVGLTHFFDNELGGSTHGVAQAGLTEFGRNAVKAMEKKHMLIDLSHASAATINDVLLMANNPVIVSHTGVKGTCNNNRNLSDDQLNAIARNGGIVGIAMFSVAVCGNDVKDIARAIAYTCNLIGAKHVALGSDFDGAINAIIEVRGLPLIVEQLLNLGMSSDDIKLIMGENVKQFLLKNLPD